MAKLVDDTVLDGALNIIKNNATQISVCADTPTTYSNATTAGAFRLALKTGLAAGDYTGPADDTSGRKLSTVAHSAISVSNSGTATHVCLCGTAATLYYVTTCTSQVLTAGNTVTIPMWKINIADPT
jgi:hypothetical protein